MAFSRIVRNRHWTILLFYFRALQLGDASKVTPLDKLSVPLTIMLSAVILHETLTWQTIEGGLLIVAGTFILLL